MTDEELRDTIEELKVDADSISDDFFREYWEEMTADKTELEDGIDSLVEGSSELADGLLKLNEMPLGIPTLEQAVSSAYDGAKKLKDGLVELQDETDELMDE